MPIELRDFDPAEYLDEAGQTELLDDAVASGDAAYLAHAIGTIARAKGGLLSLERRTGIKRQTLAKSLGKSGNPTLETLLPVLKALGLKLNIVPEAEIAA
jgi:probable addiction module antidote protein